MSQKKNEGIRFPTEIRVVGSYTDRLLSVILYCWSWSTTWSSFPSLLFVHLALARIDGKEGLLAWAGLFKAGLS